jgi:hypothetical protein
MFSARLSMTLPASCLRISIAFSRSPAAAVKASLHFIIGMSVISRSAFTAAAVISAIAPSSLQIEMSVASGCSRPAGIRLHGRALA